MTNGLWEQSSILRFSLWTHLLRPEQAHDERPERTHPNLPIISRLTTKGGSVEANYKERGGGGLAVSNSNSRHKKYKT